MGHHCGNALRRAGDGAVNALFGQQQRALDAVFVASLDQAGAQGDTIVQPCEPVQRGHADGQGGAGGGIGRGGGVLGHGSYPKAWAGG